MIIKTENMATVIGASEYISGYADRERFMSYCMECDSYGNSWACPPFGFDTIARVGRYKYAYILGVKAFIDEDIRHSPRDAAEQLDISYRIMEQARRGMDAGLLSLEADYPGSAAFFAGKCFVCRPGECSRPQGRSCAYPEKARPSLESHGFDIEKTASVLLGTELRWSENLVLPEYFMLVGGLFSDHGIDAGELAGRF